MNIKKISFHRLKLRLILILAIIGPGLITAVADNDAGGIATYTVGAALFGMSSQFLIIPTTLLLGATQELGTRLALVTGKGLGDLIRERYGIRISVLIFSLYFIVNQGVVLQNISGLKSALRLLNFPPISLVLLCLIIVFVVIKFNYEKLQKIFLFLLLFYVSYIISAFMSKPNWQEAFYNSIVSPKLEYIKDIKYWFAMVSILGTTITAWGQFFINSYVKDKRLTMKHHRISRIEAYVGAIITNFFSWMLAMAVTYTIFVHNIKVTDGFTAALAIKPLLGDLSYILFALGLFGASVLGLVIVPLATAYVFAEFFGYEGSLDVSFSRAKQYYSIFLIQVAIALVITLFPSTNLFGLTLYVDYLNGAMLPVILFFIIKFTENKALMGKYVSRGPVAIFVRVAAIVLTIVVVSTFIGSLIGLG